MHKHLSFRCNTPKMLVMRVQYRIGDSNAASILVFVSVFLCKTVKVSVCLIYFSLKFRSERSPCVMLNKNLHLS